jgi:hypothetical protein
MCLFGIESWVEKEKPNCCFISFLGLGLGGENPRAGS